MPETDRPSPSSRSASGALALLLGLFLVLTVPLLIAGKSGHSEMGDQQKYHLPVIEQFATELPTPDLVDYDSATAPGYHLLMALIHRATDGSERAMVAVSWALSLLLVLAVAGFASRLVGWRLGAMLTLPLALSSYTIGGATALSTDNFAVLFVTLALGGSILLPWNKSRAWWLSLASAMAVFSRQIFIWTIAPIGLVGLLASPLGRHAPRALRDGATEKRWSNLLVSIAACGVPVAILGVLIVQWGGLVPASSNPEITKHAGGPNPATFAYAFALLGVFATPFAVLVGGTLRDLRTRPVLVMSSIALLCALVVPTSFSPKERAYGWFWQIVVRHTPDVMERSIVLTIFAIVGGASIGVLWRRLREAGRTREGITLALTMLGWLLAQSVNTMAWQKYFEQILLIALAWMAALALSARAKTPARWRWAVFGALVVFQLLFSGAKFYRQAFMGMK